MPATTLGLPIALLALAQGLLALLALGDVDHHAIEPSLPVVAPDHADHVADPHDAAVGRDQAILEIVVEALLGQKIDFSHGPIAIFGMQSLRPQILLDPVGGREAGDALDLRSDISDLERGDIGFPRHRARGFGQRSKPLLAAAQGNLGLLDVGDVEMCADDSHRMTAGIALDHAPARQQPAPSVVLRAHAIDRIEQFGGRFVHLCEAPPDVLEIFGMHQRIPCIDGRRDFLRRIAKLAQGACVDLEHSGNQVPFPRSDAGAL